MNVAILTFSPSYSTRLVGDALAERLRSRGYGAQHVDISGESRVFERGDMAGFLDAVVEAHDVICVGAPVYGRHFQYHALDLIEALPRPDQRWAKIAVPFVTYGALSSGIALEEAGRAFSKSGRKVVAGLKVSAAHSLTPPLLDYTFNEGQPDGPALAVLDDLVDRIACLDEAADAMDALAYRDRDYWVESVTALDERKSHAERYPQIVIDDESCTGCGACEDRCPVRHLRVVDGKAQTSDASPCIHCFSCLAACEVGAITLPVEKAHRMGAFLADLIEKGAHREQPATVVYPVRRNEDIGRGEESE